MASRTLSALGDVLALLGIDGTDPQDGQSVVWNAAKSKFVPSQRGGVDPLAQGLGYVNWNFNPALGNTASSMSTQLVYLNAIWLPFGVPVTNVVYNVNQAASGTAPTNAFFGLAKPKVGGGATMLSLSADLAATIFAVTGPQVIPLSSPYTPVVGDSPTGIFYVVGLVNGTWSVTQPTMYRGTASTGAGKVLGSSTILNAATGVTTGQTALPAVGADIAGGLTGVSSVGFAVGCS